MSFDRIVSMLFRMFARRAVNRGLRSGLRAMDGQGPKRRGGGPEARAARRKARMAARAMRRMGRF